MLSFEEALGRILTLGSPTLAAEDGALDGLDGRVLAEDLVARFDIPGFDYSSMDGYAVRAADAPPDARLPVRGESKTGAIPPALELGSAMRIFTGAPIPSGADAVVMQENVTRDGDWAAFAKWPSRGQFVRRRGEDLAAGAIAIAKGTRLRPAHLALAASLDEGKLRVSRSPAIAILATGDELRVPGSTATPGTIPESITVALRAMAARAGATARALPFVPDDRAATERAFASAFAEADVVVTVGGVSVGDHDLVRPALESVGVVLDFWRVAIKPGKPLAVGRLARPGKRDAIALGLPGNPASAMVTFALFGMPLLRAMQGDALPFPRTLRARLTRAVARQAGRLEFARAALTYEGGSLTVTPLGNQASGATTAMARCDALALFPAETSALPAGTEVEVLLVSDLG